MPSDNQTTTTFALPSRRNMCTSGFFFGVRFIAPRSTSFSTKKYFVFFVWDEFDRGTGQIRHTQKMQNIFSRPWVACRSNLCCHKKYFVFLACLIIAISVESMQCVSMRQRNILAFNDLHTHTHTRPHSPTSKCEITSKSILVNKKGCHKLVTSIQNIRQLSITYTQPDIQFQKCVRLLQNQFNK